jgi:dolichol-phosphate mannosyltransferase
MQPMQDVPGPLLSVVVPVFDEAENLEPLLARLLPVLDSLPGRFEIMFVDDGSTDDTPVRLARLAIEQSNLRVLRLSRNFGHQAALAAGMERARGDAVITIDGDLQHPPELIAELVERWRAGFQVVQAVRREPVDTSALKRASSRGFYRLLSWVSRLRVTPGAADYRLMTREAVDAFLACPERCRFNRGLVQWIGFDYAEVPYQAAPRRAGRSKYSYRAMLRLAGDAIFSFSSWPLRLAGLAGMCVSLAAAGYLVFVLWAALFTERTVPGWSSILATLLILGGAQLIVLWILGEYVGRLYEEVKQRPLYVIRRERPEQESSCAAGNRPAENTLESSHPNED